MGDSLPYTDEVLIAECKQDYECSAQLGGQEAVDACFRYTWALVHSHKSKQISQGLDLIEALIAGDRADKRDLAYLKAVGLFRRGQHLEARTVLKSLLEEHPEFRQGSSLLELVEKEIVKDGLIGAGVAAAVLGVVAVLAGAAMSSSKR